jgi:hypothetical protein
VQENVLWKDKNPEKIYPQTMEIKLIPNHITNTAQYFIYMYVTCQRISTMLHIVKIASTYL